ncbi:LamG-like jellyroll fold domain-containing protein [Phycisphaerales bacterium AB-hyl4]|uniref:beta-N-acetylhexosaminidase n=1 Tax=Natronomicrosphaera hydrolytica TaxID=3242702 RepID=A0ABV4U911_9BACT
MAEHSAKTRNSPTRTKLVLVMFSILVITCGLMTSSANAEPINLEQMLISAGANSDQRVPARFGRGFRVSRDHEPLRLTRGMSAENGFTFDTWFLIEEHTAQGTIFSADAWGNCQFVIRGNEHLVLDYRRGQLTAHHPLEKNRWYHVAVRLEPGKRASIFLDGQLVAHREDDVDAPHEGASIRVLGAWRINDRRGYRNYFHGVIDRSRYWSRILNDEEIRVAYEQGNQQADIVPLPQHVMRHSDEEFTPGGRIDFSLDPGLVRRNNFAVEAVRDAVRAWSPDVQVTLGERRPNFEHAAIVLARPTAETLETYLNLNAAHWDELPDEGYALYVRKDRIIVYANDRRGAQHGLMSLKQLFEHEDLAAMDIWDYPEYPFRGTMLVNDSKPPYRFNDEHRQMIDRMAELKQNQFMLRSHSWLVLSDPAVHQRMQRMVAHANNRGVEVSPYIQAYSHAKGFLWQDLKTGHTTAVDDEQGTFGSDDFLELEHRNVILNAVTPIKVSLNGESLEAGRDYEVVPGVTEASWSGHPEGTRSTWARPHIPEDNEPWRLRRLEGGRIPAGSAVQVSYAYASGEETTCPFSPDTWERLEDAVRRSLEMTRASYLNLGMDEVWVIRREECRACQQNPMSPEQTTLYAMNRAYEVARQVDSDVHVMLWADMLDEYFKANWAAPLDSRLMDELYSQGEVSSEIIMMPWEYSGWVHAKQRGLQYMRDRGFPVVGASGFTFDNNLVWSEASLQVEPADAGVRGLLFCTWDSNRFEQWAAGLEGHAMATWSPHRLRFSKAYKLLQMLEPFEVLSQNPGGVPMDRAAKLQLQALHAKAQRELDQAGPVLTERVQGLAELQDRIQKAGDWISRHTAGRE